MINMKLDAVPVLVNMISWKILFFFNVFVICFLFLFMNLIIFSFTHNDTEVTTAGWYVSGISFYMLLHYINADCNG